MQSKFNHKDIKNKHSEITISYRDDGNGGGPFFDHYTIQKITNTETTIALSPQHNISSFQQAVLGNSHTLLFGNEYQGKKLPKIAPNNPEGLLIITGQSSNYKGEREKTFVQRQAYEKALLKEARLIGRPVLTICGGTWGLIEAFGGSTVAVTGHNCRQGMPRINNDGNIGYNIQSHNIKIQGDSLLSQLMGYTKSVMDCNFFTNVNSVHWKAPYNLPTNFVASAISVKKDKDIDENTIEAVESEFGVPMVGIQWHPESYNKEEKKSDIKDNDKHRNIFCNMLQSGRAFNLKRDMLAEFKSLPNPSALLKKYSIFNSTKSLNETETQLEEALGDLCLSISKLTSSIK
jgi:gamma-glutamyl-gamma-aminobutyrate hydrolase PuuD